MAGEGLHSWSTQVVGDGFVETRTRLFDANNRLVEGSISVQWNDGTFTHQIVTLGADGSVSTNGSLRYPDDTHASAQFFPDGHFTVVHGHGHDASTTTWRYEIDGGATVEARSSIDLGGTAEGFAVTTWTLRPDGSPLGDLWDLSYTTNLQTGEKMEIDSRKSPDGSTTVHVRKWDAHGHLLLDETTVHPAVPHAKVETPTKTVPAKPTPSPGTGGGGGRVVTVTPTTRLPDPGASAGWGGPMGHITQHWIDHWLVTPDGRTTLLGSELVKTELEIDE